MKQYQLFGDQTNQGRDPIILNRDPLSLTQQIWKTALERRISRRSHRVVPRVLLEVRRIDQQLRQFPQPVFLWNAVLLLDHDAAPAIVLGLDLDQIVIKSGIRQEARVRWISTWDDANIAPRDHEKKAILTI